MSEREPRAETDSEHAQYLSERLHRLGLANTDTVTPDDKHLMIFCAGYMRGLAERLARIETGRQ